MTILAIFDNLIPKNILYTYKRALEIFQFMNAKQYDHVYK